MKIKDIMTTGEIIALIPTCFVVILFMILLVLSIKDKETLASIKAPVQQTGVAFPYKIKFNEYGAAYYMVPLMADNMSYGIVPMPVMGPDGVSLTNKDIRTNNRKE